MKEVQFVNLIDSLLVAVKNNPKNFCVIQILSFACTCLYSGKIFIPSLFEIIKKIIENFMLVQKIEDIHPGLVEATAEFLNKSFEHINESYNKIPMFIESLFIFCRFLNYVKDSQASKQIYLLFNNLISQDISFPEKELLIHQITSSTIISFPSIGRIILNSVANLLSNLISTNQMKAVSGLVDGLNHEQYKSLPHNIKEIIVKYIIQNQSNQNKIKMILNDIGIYLKGIGDIDRFFSYEIQLFTSK